MGFNPFSRKDYGWFRLSVEPVASQASLRDLLFMCRVSSFAMREGFFFLGYSVLAMGEGFFSGLFCISEPKGGEKREGNRKESSVKCAANID